jgi:multidrug efflux system membrane fusion protein
VKEAQMKLGSVIRMLLLAVVAAMAFIIYSPETAQQFSPRLADTGRQLRAYIPAPVRKIVGLGDGPTQNPKDGGTNTAGRPAMPPTPVVVADARRGPLPFRIDAIGTAQPVATVALRSRVDAQIDKIFVDDGAAVKAGDQLIKLDSRQVEAQIKQAQANLARDQSALEQAQRDVVRYADLVSKQAGTQLNLDNAKTAVAAAKAAIMGDEAAIENLMVQLTWYTITAPISGRVGTITLKTGNIIRGGDNTATGTLAVINQTTPIYVSFSLPQRLLNDLRASVAAGGAETIAIPQGTDVAAKGKVAVIDNAIDAATGTIMVRAIFENKNELLWPGQLCNVRVTLRTDPDVITIPREAVQVGQDGDFVFTVKDGKAHVRKVTVGRTQDGQDVITAGLEGSETVVVDGAPLLIEGSKVEPRLAAAKKGAS